MRPAHRGRSPTGSHRRIIDSWTSPRSSRRDRPTSQSSRPATGTRWTTGGCNAMSARGPASCAMGSAACASCGERKQDGSSSSATAARAASASIPSRRSRSIISCRARVFSPSGRRDATWRVSFASRRTLPLQPLTECGPLQICSSAARRRPQGRREDWSPELAHGLDTRGEGSARFEGLCAFLCGRLALPQGRLLSRDPPNAQSQGLRGSPIKPG